MKIADFERIPLGTRVRYGNDSYVIIDRKKRTHEAVIVSDKQGGSRHTVRCSEIELAK